LNVPAVPLPLIPLSPNRVRRNYLGGRLLDEGENNPAPRDGNCPEDWLASTVRATNPGMKPILDEGLTFVQTSPGSKVALRDVLEKDPAFYFGAAHVERLGGQLGFLAKLLDSSMRLHTQAHPTREFARKHLGSPWGKLEAYVILGVRDEGNSYIRLGFQRPPTPQEWKRIVLEQDIAAMDACFDRVPVRVGEVWLVPGGLPHAIGEGILMLEIMEPSDLVVRCEFDREGATVPPEARFMQLPVDLALQIFDFTPLSVAEVTDRYRIAPTPINDGEEILIGPGQTDCFRVTRLTVSTPKPLPVSDRLRLGVVTRGQGLLTVGRQSIPLRPGARFLVAASAPKAEISLSTKSPLELLFCAPG
jgi:mannose-6-phosphate isomerase